MTAPGALLRLAPGDSVGVALRDLVAGEALEHGVAAAAAVPAGHKVALVPLAAGAPVFKYGQVIGIATGPVVPGEHVHSHNLAMPPAGWRAGAQPPPAPGAARAATGATFQGYRRGGRAGTRNDVGVMASVNCSATVVHALVEQARRTLLPRFPNVDGLVPLTHRSGCGLGREDTGFAVLTRTLRGFLDHPNFGAVLLIGLGCEVITSGELGAGREGERFARLDIQAAGGTRAAIDQGLAHLEALLAVADADRRETLPASDLVVGLQCGGSDGLSGVTANPAMGLAIDRLVAEGGTAILSETPEIYGAEHLLMVRAATPAVADALAAKVAWWEAYAAANRVSLDNNPSPGNKAGGLTTILEKSLGAVAKGGRTALNAVIDYAAPVGSRGLVFMDSPGFDPCSATGQVASGANLLLFSTGRGSCFGCRPAPSLKLATNPEVYRRMADDMDIDCGKVLSGAPLQAVADEIFTAILETASGRPTKSEVLGYGDHEFVPWQLGAVL